MIRACPDTESYLKIAEVLKYKIFDKGLYNLNIVGWRNTKGADNSFEDWLAVYRKTEGNKWTQDFWPITTRPGVPYLLQPLTPRGTAILYPGQYIDSYQLGKHKQDKALVQSKPVTVFRDNDYDAEWDYVYAGTESGMFRIHIHRAGFFSKLIGTWSAGCQVFSKKSDFDEFIALCEKSVEIWGNSFTYTLIEF